MPTRSHHSHTPCLVRHAGGGGKMETYIRAQGEGMVCLFLVPCQPLIFPPPSASTGRALEPVEGTQASHVLLLPMYSLPASLISGT